MMSAAKDLGLKVILSGQGADESLCGYRKYMFFNLQQLCRDRQTGTLFSECASHLLPPWTMLRGFRAGDAKRYLPARPL